PPSERSPPVPDCRKCPLFLGLAGLAVVGALILTAGNAERGIRVSPGWVDGALAARLCGEHGWHIVPSAENQPAANPRRFSLADRPREWAELVVLNQTGRNLDRWAGVVLVQNLDDEELRADLFVDMPGEFPGHARLVGPVYLFGDPGMAGRIEAALRDRPRPSP